MQVDELDGDPPFFIQLMRFRVCVMMGPTTMSAAYNAVCNAESSRQQWVMLGTGK